MGTGFLGLSPAEFWELTLVEFDWLVEGHKKARLNHANELNAQAWLTASLVRAKDFPKIDAVLHKDFEHKAQTTEQMIAMARMLNTAFGGEEVQT